MRPDEPLSRERVVAVARTSIEARGIDQVSLRSVARSLGVTAPALYSYVTDKDDLVAAVAAQYFDELVDRFEAVQCENPLDAIRALGRAYVAHALGSPELFRLLFRYPPSAAGMPIPGVDDFAPATRAFQVASAATAEAIDTGLLAVDDPVAASMTMWAAVHGVCDVLLMGFEFDDATVAALADSVIETVLVGQIHGIAAASRPAG